MTTRLTHIMLATLLATLLLVLALAGHSVSADDSPKAIRRASVYAGGVLGFRDMLRPDASADFRRRGGGLFLHNTAWGNLAEQERRELLGIYAGKAIAIEIGYDKSGKTDWPHWLKGAYIDLGITPHFVTVNIFADQHVPSVVEWRTTHERLKASVPKNTLVVPTFEFANFGAHSNRLAKEKISLSEPFQQIIQIAGGLTIDAPPRVLLTREQAYRDWVVDAIQYARRKRLRSILIMSPDSSAEDFPHHTTQAISRLTSVNAMPDVVVVENYVDGPPTYPNRVGNDANPVTTLGLANRLLKVR